MQGIKVISMFMLGFGLLIWQAAAIADMEQVKIYKEANADAKPKCIDCHVDKMPKKDGAHDLNEYGKAVVDTAKKAGVDKPTADSYKAVGTVEDFAKKAAK